MWNNTAVTQAFLVLTQKLRQNSQTRAAESAGELQRAIKQTPQRHNMGHSAFKLPEKSQPSEKTNVHLLDGLRG